MVEELKGPGQYSQIGGLRLSFLFDQVFDGGPFRMPRTTLQLTMKKQHFKEAAPLPC